MHRPGQDMPFRRRQHCGVRPFFFLLTSETQPAFLSSYAHPTYIAQVLESAAGLNLTGSSSL